MKYIDPRVIRSRQALIELTLEKGYRSVTIKALTDHANVGYSTFHRQYRSIDDLAERPLKGIVADLDGRICQPHSLIGDSVGLWRYIQVHESHFRFYLALPPKHPARNVFIPGSAYFATQRYRARNSERVPLDIAVRHMVLALEQLLVMYLDDIDAFSPEQMATFSNDLVIHATESTAIEPRPEWLEEQPPVELAPV